MVSPDPCAGAGTRSNAPTNRRGSPDEASNPSPQSLDRQQPGPEVPEHGVTPPKALRAHAAGSQGPGVFALL